MGCTYRTPGRPGTLFCMIVPGLPLPRSRNRFRAFHNTVMFRESRKSGLPSGTWRGSAAHPLRISVHTLRALLAKPVTFVYLGFPALRLRLPLGARGIMAAALCSALASMPSVISLTISAITLRRSSILAAELSF